MLNQIAVTIAPTKQWKNISQSANQTVDDHLQQAANQNSGNASDGDDSNITENVKNIGKNLTEGAKNSLKQLIKMNDLSKEISIYLCLSKSF